MKRRSLLRLGAIPLLAGCVAPPGDSSGGGRVSIVSVDDPPDLPVRPAVEVVTPAASSDAPPQLRVTVTNTADHPVEVGEERDIVFAFVHSQERPGLQLLPESEEGYPAVRPGCWRLAEPIFVAEYYGIVPLDPGESTARTVGVWGSPDLEAGCLPTGEFRFLTTYTVARDEREGMDEPDDSARWGFTLRVTRAAEG